MGKGLMTVWRIMNPNSGRFPSGIGSDDRDDADGFPTVTRKQPARKKRAQQLVTLLVSNLT